MRAVLHAFERICRIQRSVMRPGQQVSARHILFNVPGEEVTGRIWCVVECPETHLVTLLNLVTHTFFSEVSGVYKQPLYHALNQHPEQLSSNRLPTFCPQCNCL